MVTSARLRYALEPLGLSETSLPPRDSSGKLAEPASRPYAGPSCVEELEEVGADGVDTGWTLDEIFPALARSVRKSAASRGDAAATT